MALSGHDRLSSGAAFAMSLCRFGDRRQSVDGRDEDEAYLVKVREDNFEDLWIIMSIWPHQMRLYRADLIRASGVIVVTDHLGPPSTSFGS